MKTLAPLVLLISLFTTFTSFSQSIKIGFKERQEVIKYEPSDTLKIPYTITLSGNYFPDVDHKILVTIISDSEKLNPYLEKKGEIFIKQSITKGELIFHAKNDETGIIKNLTQSIIDKDEFLNLEIKPLTTTKFILEKKDTVEIKLGQNKKTISLRKKKLTSNSHYNFYLGANFDLKETLKANSFYSELEVFLPGQFFKNKDGNLWGGIRAGIYKTEIETTFKDEARDGIVLTIKEDAVENDSITLEKQFATITPRTTFSNIGLYAQLLFRTYSSPNEQFQVFMAPHAEIIQRTETTNFEISDVINLGNITIPRDSIISREYRPSLARTRERTRKFYNTYFGIGFPTKYKSNQIEVFINPVIGYGDSAILNSRNDSGNMFGIIQFYLIDDILKLKLSGEVRKYFNANQNPLLTINLSKRFNLDTWMEPKKAKPD